MHIDDILRSADFSKETNFKERLHNKLNVISSDGELSDDDAATVTAARGIISSPAYHETDLERLGRKELIFLGKVSDNAK